MDYNWFYGPATVKDEDGLQNVVMDIAWTCLGTIQGSMNDYKATGMVTTPPVDKDHFVPFDQISKQQVEDWVFASVDKSAVEAQLLAQSNDPANVKPFNF